MGLPLMDFSRMKYGISPIPSLQGRGFDRNKEAFSSDTITHWSSCRLFDSRFFPVLPSTVLCAI